MGAACLIFGASSCQKPAEDAAQEVKAINTEFMDTSVKPSEDFFRYVNGNWIDKTQIPGDQGRWGSFNELREYNNEVVLEVLNKAKESGKHQEGSDAMKAAAFYQIGMDSARADKMGYEPIKPYLAKVAEITDKATLQAYLEWQETYGGGVFFGFGVSPDLKNSSLNVAYLGAGGLGLPERDYYFKEDEKSAETRKKYVEYVGSMLEMIGEENAQDKAQKIMELETELAAATLTKEARRNIDTLYNKMSTDELSQLAASIDWKKYFEGIGANNVDEVIVTQPLFIETYEKVVNTYDMDIIRAYLKWHMANDAATYLSNDFEVAKFNFYSKYLRGVEEQSPRWKRVLRTTNGFLGEAIGQLYVAETFPPEAKKKAQAMVDNIKVAFGERIQNLEWMSDETKEKALKKLSTFTVKIGYPDKWKDYGNMQVANGEDASYFANVMAGSKFNYEESLKDLGQPVDKTKWGMSPQTVNAYYNPLFNEIVFPAGILQPPFYNYKADEAVNYGGIGAVIGHEISHGFDDQGSRFDSEGNLKNWWTEDDLTSFKGRTQKLIDQYDAFEPLEGVHVNGQFTLGENIGDLGGINAAYDGLQLFLEKNGRPAEIDGMTPEQRFFVSWATIWRTKYKDEFIRTQVQTDPHSPAMYRGNGPLSNLETFYQAFDVKPGDGMHRPDSLRVKIW